MKMNLHIAYNPAILSLGLVHPRGTLTHVQQQIAIKNPLITASFIVTKNWETHKCPAIGE